jgi:CubicO group peptidase (beta-lactamase class C family)
MVCVAAAFVAMAPARAQSPAAAAASAFPEARRAAAALPRLHGLAVSSNGSLIFEYYARGHGANRPANIKSAAKSVIAALTGISIDRGLIKSVREPIATWFPELRRDRDPRKQAITVEDLLTMRSGLESTSGENYGRWVSSSNWVAYALSRPLVMEPGTGMQYSTGTSHVLSAILTKVSGTSTWQFAQNAIGVPLKITIPRWTRDPQGIYFGGNEMLLTPRQMLAFGELYLNRGLVNGQQVLPAAWVDTSCVPRTYSRYDAGREYGYGWWIDELAGRQACFAWGFGGQYVFVLRDLQLVIVTTSATTVSDERRGYRRQLWQLIEDHLIAPIERQRAAGTR